MTLNERIAEDMKTAMKSGAALKLSTLRTLRAQLIALSKRGTGGPITSEDETGVLLSAIKKRKEAIEMYEKGGRSELAAKEREEISIITSYRNQSGDPSKPFALPTPEWKLPIQDGSCSA